MAKINKKQHITKNGVVKKNPVRKINGPYEYVSFVCVVYEGQDSYFVDDSGDYDKEYHTIKRNGRVFTEIVKWEKSKEFYNNFIERNADNPPYDTYHIKLAYDTYTKEPISLQHFIN